MEKHLNSEACKIIDALGGTSATARLCNVEPPSVTDWKTNGIPNARLMFLKLARPDVFEEVGHLPEKKKLLRAAEESNEELRRDVDLCFRQPADHRKIDQ